ncbi:MAG: hypothetical protein RR060_04430 [Victivallaceae bacterium]
MGKKRFKIKRNKFTLLEIILALAIFCLIAGLSGGLIYTVRQSYQSISDTDNYLKRQFRLDLVINEVFRNSIPLNWPALNNVDKLYFQGKNNALRTVYQYRINQNRQSGMRFINLELLDGELFAIYSDYPCPEQQPTAQRELIADKISGIQLKYAVKNRDTITWQDNFNLDGQEKNLPLAISLTINFADGESINYLRRTAGNSYFTSYGRRDENTTRKR